MKILLSAYACEPNKGSEPGVGWNWAIGLASAGHDVWVLTRSNNKPVIDDEVQSKPYLSKIKFIYYDLPYQIRRYKNGNRGIYLYYLLWQWGAYKVAKIQHNLLKFDLVHHVTFVNVRQPSFMGNLKIPFIFGPVSGGDSAPWCLRLHYGVRGIIIDAIRDCANLLVSLDPLMWHTFRQAKKIYVTSKQTKNLLPKCFHDKTMIQLAIALENDKFSYSKISINQASFRILYVGHFIYLKGMGIGLQAFAKLVQQVPKARLTMVGEGPDEQRWRKLADELNISDNIDWIPWVNRNMLTGIYQNHDCFLFPSLHDSGGMVVLEAMANGLPVVCLNLGGPGEIINDSCGFKINTANKSKNLIVEDLVDALYRLANDEDLRERLRNSAFEQLSNFSWAKKIEVISREEF